MGACGPAGDLSQLAPPPAGEGLQVSTPDIVVGPGEEIQNCYFFRMSDLLTDAGLDATKPLNLHRVQIAQRDGSHHFNVFRVRTVAGMDPAVQTTYEGKNGQGECFKSTNWADWPLVANSQQDGHLDWTFPDGVANVIQPDEWIMLQTHYVNAVTQSTPTDAGRVNVNLWHLPEGNVVHEMGTLFATKQSIRVCESNPTPKFSGACSFSSTEPVHVIGANGHFHSRGTQFEMFSWDGQAPSVSAESDRFYQSKKWDDPPMEISPTLDRVVPAGGGVFYTCEYQWQQPDPSVGCQGLNDFDQTKYMTPAENLDCCYTFGPIVEKNEHCNIFVYFYPKGDQDVNCF